MFDPDDPSRSTPFASFWVLTIGNAQSAELLRYSDVLEAEVGVAAIRQFVDMQPSDVPAT